MYVKVIINSVTCESKFCKFTNSMCKVKQIQNKSEIGVH